MFNPYYNYQKQLEIYSKVHLFLLPSRPLFYNSYFLPEIYQTPLFISMNEPQYEIKHINILSTENKEEEKETSRKSLIQLIINRTSIMEDCKERRRGDYIIEQYFKYKSEKELNMFHRIFIEFLNLFD